MLKWTIDPSRCLQLLLLIASLHCFLVQSQNATSTSVILASTPFNATEICAMVENGTYLKDPTACDTWIQCINDEPIFGTCGTGLFYDRNTNQCVESDSIKCYSSDPCATVTNNDFVADPYSCSHYYYCYNGQGTLGTCSSGLNYNPGTGVCVRNFTCPQEPDPNNLCNIIPDGEFFSSNQSCQDYNMCLNFVLETGACPNGYYFNAFKSVCDYQDQVECNIAQAHPNLPGAGICQTEGQFVSDNATCSGYYYCKETSTDEFILIWGQCSSGRFFDPIDGGECVDRNQIVCDYNRCDGLGTTNIQLANSPNDGCVGYLICEDGEEIGAGLCPSDQMYYDEVSQRCTASVIAYPACIAAATTTSTATSAVTNPAAAG